MTDFSVLSVFLVIFCHTVAKLGNLYQPFLCGIVSISASYATELNANLNWLAKINDVSLVKHLSWQHLQCVSMLVVQGTLSTSTSQLRMAMPTCWRRANISQCLPCLPSLFKILVGLPKQAKMSTVTTLTCWCWAGIMLNLYLCFILLNSGNCLCKTC